MTHAIEVGIDIGGTFTDVACRGADGTLRSFKVPTTRSSPADAVRDALQQIVREWKVDPSQIVRLVHGTTVATNAVLERRGARIGLVTTAGFRDVLEIGRGARREIYDTVIKPQTPVFLAPRSMRRDVPERLAPDGSVLMPLDEEAVKRAVAELCASGARAIAVCFLFSYANPEHEQRARSIIEEHFPGLYVSLSCEVDPAFREYERTAVTAFDAYVKPILDGYLSDMEQHLAAERVHAPLQVMQSRGGVCSTAVARRRPVRLFLSGPAAGAIGGALIGERVGVENMITVDIGGTSCDIALITRGEPMIRNEGIIDRFPVRVGMVDINAIGSGGGSIAWLDAAGVLRVGPQSAGSEPGPACYGRGAAEPTVTDASVVLGYLNPDYFAGGALKLDARLADRTIRAIIAEPMGVTTEAAALGIHRVVNAQMAEGIRLMSINRGVDPREYALVALGGAGPLHACALAQELHIDQVVIPSVPGVLSAIGLLAAPVEHEISIAYGRRFDELSAEAVLTQLGCLDVQCAALMATDGVAPHEVHVQYSADVCFIGQSYYLGVPIDATTTANMLAALYRDFVAAHERVYGHAAGGPARIVNLRSVHRARGGVELCERSTPCSAPRAPVTRSVLLPGSAERAIAAVYDRHDIAEGTSVRGPAIIEQADTTTLVLPGWRLQRLASGDIMMTREAKPSQASSC